MGPVARVRTRLPRSSGKQRCRSIRWAAAKLARTGLSVRVLERHIQAGGYATTFLRAPLEFEVSLHALSGIGTAAKRGGLWLQPNPQRTAPRETTPITNHSATPMSTGLRPTALREERERPMPIDRSVRVIPAFATI